MIWQSSTRKGCARRSPGVSNLTVSSVASKVDEPRLVQQENYAREFLKSKGKPIPIGRADVFAAMFKEPITPDEVEERHVLLDEDIPLEAQSRTRVACLNRYRVGCCECCWRRSPFYTEDVLMSSTQAEVKATRPTAAQSSTGVAGAMPAAPRAPDATEVAGAMPAASGPAGKPLTLLQQAHYTPYSAIVKWSEDQDQLGKLGLERLLVLRSQLRVKSDPPLDPDSRVSPYHRPSRVSHKR
jgi:hypothetical protein